MQKDTVMDVSEIRFTQKSIKDTFSLGNPIVWTIYMLREKKITPYEIPRIRVALYNGYYKTIDNRRLYCFKHSDIKQIPVILMAKVTQEFQYKDQSPNQGRSVKIVHDPKPKSHHSNIVRAYNLKTNQTRKWTVKYIINETKKLKLNIGQKHKKCCHPKRETRKERKRLKKTVIENPHGSNMRIKSLLKLKFWHKRRCVIFSNETLSFKDKKTIASNEWLQRFGNIKDTVIFSKKNYIEIEFEDENAAANVISQFNTTSPIQCNNKILKARPAAARYCKKFLNPNCNHYNFCKRIHSWKTANDVVTQKNIRAIEINLLKVHGNEKQDASTKVNDNYNELKLDVEKNDISRESKKKTKKQILQTIIKNDIITQKKDINDFQAIPSAGNIEDKPLSGLSVSHNGSSHAANNANISQCESKNDNKNNNDSKSKNSDSNMELELSEDGVTNVIENYVEFAELKLNYETQNHEMITLKKQVETLNQEIQSHLSICLTLQQDNVNLTKQCQLNNYYK
eukprot:222912_1